MYILHIYPSNLFLRVSEAFTGAAENKRYLKIDQHLAWYFVYYGACLSNPPHFLWSQIIIPFLTSMISNNLEKGLEFQPVVEPLYPYSSSSVESLFS